MYRSGGGRINERDVPESQHTVFIRGLPGNMGTDEIREFFEKDFGSCTFDFVKVSPDRTKLYVAVRFDSKLVARDVMERFSSDGDMLGYKVEMTWFRDIRRYLAHCAKQGIRPSRLGGGGGRDRDAYRGDRFGGRGRGRSRSRSRSRGRLAIAISSSRSQSCSRSRSYSRSRSRSLSRTPSPDAADQNHYNQRHPNVNQDPPFRYRLSRFRPLNRSPTRSPDRTGGRSRSTSLAGSDAGRGANGRRSHSRSRSADSRSASSAGDDAQNRSPTPRSDRERSLDYSEIAVKKERLSPPREHSPSPPPAKRSKREKREKRKEKKRDRRRYSPSPERGDQRSGSDMEMDEEEEEAAKGTKQQKQQDGHKIFIGPVIPTQPPPPQHQQGPPPPLPNFYQRHLPAGTAPPPPNEAAIRQQQQPPPPQVVHIHHQQQQQSQSPQKQQQQEQVQQQAKVVPKVELRNQSILLDLSDPKNVSMPKFKPIGEASGLDFSDRITQQQVDQQQQYLQINGAKEDSTNRASPPPPVLRNVPPTASSTISNSSTNFLSSTPVQDQVLPLNNFKEIQRAILHDIRYKAHEEEEEDQLGQLRLSSLSRKALTDEKREEKLAKLSAEMRERVNKKKRQLELSYRNDCETYGLVVNKLIAKDRALEERLKVALLETMKELETETMKQLDEFVDQLSFLCG